MPANKIISPPYEEQPVALVTTDEDYTFAEGDQLVMTTATGLTVTLPESPLYGRNCGITAGNGDVDVDGNGFPVVGTGVVPDGDTVYYVFATTDEWSPTGTSASGATGPTGATGPSGGGPTGPTGADFGAVGPTGAIQIQGGGGVVASSTWINPPSTDQVNTPFNSQQTSRNSVDTADLCVWQSWFDIGEALNIGQNSAFDPTSAYDELYLIANGFVAIFTADTQTSLQALTDPVVADPQIAIGPNLVISNGSQALADVFGGGIGVLGLLNGVAPTIQSSTGGTLLYSEGGAAKAFGGGGTVTTFGPADPHCPQCGSDHGWEWKNELFDEYTFACARCLLEALNKLGVDTGKFTITTRGK